MLTSLKFVDEDTGFAATQGGLFRIYNGGVDWKKISIDPETNHLYNDFALKDFKPFLVLDGFSRIYHYDSVTGWEKIFGTSTGLNSISLGSRNMGWIVGNAGFIARIHIDD